MILVFLLLSILVAGAVKPQHVEAIKLKEPITLDGVLNEKQWNGNAVTNFVQRDPVEGHPASEKSSVWVAYDNEHLYIAAKLFDTNPDSIDQTVARRDNYVNSDWFYVYLDPHRDKRTGNFFAVNAGGSKMDGVLYNDSWNDDSWDGIWDAEVSVSDEGWAFEMRIPFSQLRFKDREDMVWGINFNRDIKRKNEMDYFVMVPKTESGFVSHFAELKGLNGIKPKQRFELLPYVVQKAQYLQHDDNDPFYKSNMYNTAFGADFKVGIGSNLNLDATINPDFGQVEVDPAVLNLSAFETFFSEKRPFFIEGSNIFGFGFGGANSNWNFNFGIPELFYSRRIGRQPQIWSDTNDDEFVDRPTETRILGALKLTGKLDSRTSLGVLSAATQKMHNTIQGPVSSREEAIEPFTHYGVVRSRREFDEGRHAVGVIFTSVNRNLDSPAFEENLADQAYTLGFDGWTTLDDEDTYVVTGTLIGSYISGSKAFMTSLQERPYRYLQRPDANYMRLDPNRTSLEGMYGRVAINKQKGNFYLNSAIGFISPGFENNDLGFQWMADRINGSVVAGYKWYESDGLFRRKNFFIAKFNSLNFEGKNLSNGIYGRYWGQFENYWEAFIMFDHSFGNYSPSFTRGGPLAKFGPSSYFYGSLLTDSRKDWRVEPSASYGTNKYGSYDYNLSLDFTWKPQPNLSISFGPGYSFNFEKMQWVDSFEDATEIFTYGKRYVFAELTQKTISANIRLNWSFTPDVSLQWFVQPFFTVGDYNKFKQFARPSGDEYTLYGDKVVYDEANEEYFVDPDGSGPSLGFTVSEPDFNFKSIRSNMVLRWEVLPGSIFYLVWTHDKTNFEDPGDFKPGRDFNNLMSARPDNIFLAKFSYWLDI